jgi:DNA (cytosine-5)-methyltransferase 1
MWASPDCKHHSKAKGGKPLSRNIRDLAWVVTLWAARRSPRLMCLENVEEFRDWGPLGDDDRPLVARRGETFKRWTRRLEALGYVVEHRELRACDYGAPTIRKRLFVIARRDGRPIVWPVPTHGDPKSEAVKAGALKPWRTAAEIIDWSLPCPSIFLSREEGRRAGANRPLAENTLKRIAKGVKRYVIDAAEPFIVPVTHSGDSRVHGVCEPLRTVTTAQRGEHALVAAHLTKLSENSIGVMPDEPLHTVMAGAPRHGVVAAHLTKFHSGSVGADLDAPAPAVTANSFLKRPGGAAPIGVVSAHLSAYYGEGEGGADRSAPLDEPARTVTTENRHAVVAAFLAQHNTDMVGHAAREPVSTIVQKGCTQAVVSAGLVSLKGAERRGRPIEAPHPAVTAQGFHSAEVRAFLVKYYGEGGQDQGADEPLHTVPTRARFGLVKVKGELFEIADIGMRMLRARELFRAQGFPDEYVIDRRPDGGALTATAAVRMCGNSVCPPLAAAIVAANYRADEADAPAAQSEPGPLFREAAE